MMQQPQTPVNVRWGEWLSEGWAMFAERWQVWVVQFLIFGGIFLVPAISFYAMAVMMQVNTPAGEPPTPPPYFLPLILIAVPLLLLASAFLLGGVWKTAFKQLRGEPIAVRDLFSGGDVMLRIIGAYIAIGLMTILGALLCIFPALIVAGLFYFTIPYLIERDTDISSALSASYEATKDHWLMYLLFALFLGLLGGVGQYACLVGMLVTYPLTFTIMAVAYRDIFGVGGARGFGQQTTSTASSYVGQNWPAPPSVIPPPPPISTSPFAAPAETQIEEPSSSTPRCSNCGAAVAPTAKFCNFCGNRLGESS